MTTFRSPGGRASYSVLGVAEAAIDRAAGYYTGETERACKRADKTGDMLALLISKLHAKGALTDEDVLDLVGDDWEVVEAA